MKEGYIKRKTSTIPFGYEFDDLTGYLKPIEEQIIALSVAEVMVQDEEISLNVPDVARVLAVYESINGGQPTFDTLTLNASANVATNAIIGENVVGQTSNAIARVVINNATTPTGDVMLNTKNFTKGDNYTIIVEFR